VAGQFGRAMVSHRHYKVRQCAADFLRQHGTELGWSAITVNQEASFRVLLDSAQGHTPRQDRPYNSSHIHPLVDLYNSDARLGEKVWAAMRLGELHDNRGTDYLLQIYQGGNTQQLREVDDYQQRFLLTRSELEAVQHGNLDRQLATLSAAKALHAKGIPLPSVEPLISLIGKGPCGSGVLQFIDESRESRAIERLCTLITNEHMNPGLADVVEFLGRVKEPRAVEPICNLLADQDAEPRARVVAATVLGNLGDRRALPALSAARSSSYEELVTASTEATRKIDPWALLGFWATTYLLTFPILLLVVAFASMSAACVVFLRARRGDRVHAETSREQNT